MSDRRDGDEHAVPYSTGLCSAHPNGEDEHCHICYPNKRITKKQIICVFCGSVTLMVPCRFGMRQFCIDCERRIEERAKLEDNRKTCAIVNELCNEVLAWKHEAVKRGYKGAVRLVYEDSNGKGVSEKYLMDMWTRLKAENKELKDEIGRIKK